MEVGSVVDVWDDVETEAESEECYKCDEDHAAQDLRETHQMTTLTQFYQLQLLLVIRLPILLGQGDVRLSITGKKSVMVGIVHVYTYACVCMYVYRVSMCKVYMCIMKNCLINNRQ